MFCELLSTIRQVHQHLSGAARGVVHRDDFHVCGLLCRGFEYEAACVSFLIDVRDLQQKLFGWATNYAKRDGYSSLSV